MLQANGDEAADARTLIEATREEIDAEIDQMRAEWDRVERRR